MKRIIKSWRFERFVLLSLLLSALLSCQKEEVNTQISNLSVNDGITYRDGRLIFKDDLTFINHQRWLLENQNNPQLIADKNKSLGLKSMTEIYFDGMKLEETDPLFLAYIEKYPNIFNKETYDNSTLYRLPHSTILCYSANKDGVYQVGDLIKRITWKYVYQLNASNESKMDLLYLPKDQISDVDIKIIPSVSETKTGYAQRTRYFSNSNYRIVSSLQSYGEGIILYWDIQTNPQKKTLGIWGRSQLNTKSAKGTGVSVDMYGFGGPIIFNDNENTGLSSVTIVSGLYPLDYVLSYCPAYSRGRLDTQYIYVYWPDAIEPNPTFEEPNWTPGIDEPF
jgi:hypothetical protein